MLSTVLTDCRRSVLLSVIVLSQSTAAPVDSQIDFSRDILPVLSNKCFVCHGPDAEEGQLRLDSFESATVDLGGYHAIDSDAPVESEILRRIHDQDDPMPPEDAEKQLTPEERSRIERWVRSGGQYAKHWAFVPPKKKNYVDDVPATKNLAIDAYIAERLKTESVDFAERADWPTLARRVALVLTGLPPEPTQLARFLQNPSEAAYQRLVEELLASPRFGEHQARYWLDAVRYGDTHGLHLDNRRGIYPYRDWVVRSFNQNLPIDEFIRWQLAGDLLPDPTTEQLIATGFVRLNPSTGEGGAIEEEFQAKNNFDRTETLGTVLLGMTLTCVRCHTHKYDPILHDEYYGLFAFFNNTAEAALDGNKYDYAPALNVPPDQDAWHRWQDLEIEQGQFFADVADDVAAYEALTPDTVVAGEETETVSDVPSENDEAQANVEESTSTGDTQQAWTTLSPSERLERLADPEGKFASAPFHERAVELAARIKENKDAFVTTLIAEELSQPRETRRFERGEYDRPMGEPILPDVPVVMGGLPADAPRNRLGLAQWLTSQEHPLVSRVLVNRIWQRVFGDGLVRTPEDFGLQGEQATHPELLDWLAVELQESGWDLKQMLRLMVHSRAFQQSSQRRTDVEDPENRLWARGPTYRLDAEVIRDMALWSSGLLNTHMGGEGVKPYQPAGMWKAMAHPASNTKEYERDSGQRLYRRSLYVYWKRSSPHPMMTLFDAPDRESSCVRRSRTSTALQSLGLLNETQRLEMGRGLAERLLQSADTDDARITRMFQSLACREPNTAERAACLRLLKSMRLRYSATREGAREEAIALLSVGEAARNEQLDPCEQAAWTQVALVVLASDLALMLY